jgi:hypothetical protein
MKQVTVVYDVYNFDELSEKAKEVVKDNLSEVIIRDRFEWLKSDLEESLKACYDIDGDIFYSLTSSQGDGLYFDSDDLMTKPFYDLMMKMVEDNNSSVEDKATIKAVVKVFYDHRSNLQVYTKHDHYNRYAYASKRDINIDVLDEVVLEDLRGLKVFEDLSKDKAIADSRHAFDMLLATFEKVVTRAYLKICKDYEDIGYKVYEVSDEDIKDLIQSNDYVFHSDGRIF